MPNSSVSCLFFHAYTWIPSALHYLDIYLDLQIFLCVVFFFFLLDLCAASGMSHLFLSIFSPPSPLLTVFWVFLDINAAYHAGSCLQ